MAEEMRFFTSGPEVTRCRMMKAAQTSEQAGLLGRLLHLLYVSL
jgi:hypothetical protein